MAAAYLNRLGRHFRCFVVGARRAGGTLLDNRSYHPKPRPSLQGIDWHWTVSWIVHGEIIDCHWLALIGIDCHWFALIPIDSHWFPLTGEAGGWPDGLSNHVSPARLAPTYRWFFHCFCGWKPLIGIARSWIAHGLFMEKSLIGMDCHWLPLTAIDSLFIVLISLHRPDGFFIWPKIIPTL